MANRATSQAAAVPRCLVAESRSYSLDRVPMGSPTLLQRAGQGSFWITSIKPSDTQTDNRPRAYVGRLDADGLSILREFPPGTVPACHAVSPDGRHWLAGQAAGVLAPDASSVKGWGSWTGYLVELDMSGSVLGAGPISGIPLDCRADPSGGLFLTGKQLWDGRDIEPHEIWAHYGANRELDWLQGLTGASFTWGNVLALGRDGSLYSCGSSADDVLLARLDGTGSLHWHREFGTGSSDRCHSMALDSSDNVWFSGFYLHAADFGGGVLPELADDPQFLAKFDANGQHLLSRALPRVLTSLTVDATDHLWALTDSCEDSCAPAKLDAVDRYDAQGRLECRFNLGNAGPLSLVAEGESVWVAYLPSSTTGAGGTAVLSRLVAPAGTSGVDVGEAGVTVDDSPARDAPEALCTAEAVSGTGRQVLARQGSVSCERAVDFSVTRHRNASWILQSASPDGFPELFAFANGSVTGYDLPTLVAGELRHSSSEFPAVLERHELDGDYATTLVLGLPHALHRQTLHAADYVVPQFSDNGLFWISGTRAGPSFAGPDITLHWAASLDEPSSTVSYSGFWYAQQIIPHANAPCFLARDADQWFAVSPVGKKPVGVAARYDCSDWLLDRERAMAVLELSSSATPNSLNGSARVVAVLGTEAEFRAHQVTQLYGTLSSIFGSVEQDDPLTADYVPAPVLVLSGAKWVEPSYVVSSHEVDHDCGQRSTKPGATGQQRALARLGRDSQGVPWLVAAITTADVMITTGKDYNGELCDKFVSTKLDNLDLVLKLVRLAAPTVERNFEIGPVWDAGGVVLEMAGSRGTLAVTSAASAGLWEIDLDALGE